MEKIIQDKTGNSNFTILVVMLLTLVLHPFSTPVLAFDAPPKDQGHTGPKAGQPKTKPHSKPQQCSVADPINVKNGDFYITEDDFFIPGNGFSLTLDRSYNSHNNLKEGPFGFGWTFNYDVSLIESSNGVNTEVLIKRGDNIDLSFQENSDGTFASPDGRFLTLIKSAGAYVVTEKTGVQHRFNNSGQITAIIDPNANQLSFSYDSAGKLKEMTDSSGRKLQFTFNSNNKITSIKDPANRTFTYTYDAQNNLIAYTDSGGHKKEYAYDAEHRLTGIKDAKGVEKVRNTYNTEAKVSQQFLKGGTFDFTYYDDNRTRVCDRRNNCTTYNYNESGNPTTITRPTVGSSTRTWDEDLNLIKLRDENRNDTTYSYDDKGNILTATDANNHVTQFSYEANFNKLASVTDPLNNTTQFAYDSKGNLTKITNALKQAVLKITSYDAKGNPLIIEDANGTQTKLVYDEHGRLTSRTFDDATLTYSYDNVGHVTKTTLPDNVALNFNYDTAGRLTEIVDKQGNQLKYTLDSVGNILKNEIFDLNDLLVRKGSTTYAQYDHIKETITADGRKTAFDYDENNNPITLTDALNKSSQSTYDSNDRLTKITDALSGNIKFRYDKVNNLTRVTDANGLETEYSYDDVYNLLTRTSPDTGETTNTYDQANNLLTSTDARGITASYSYDKLNRLTGVNYPNTAENISMSYDSTANGNKGIGRLTRYSDQSGNTELSYDAKDNLISEKRTIESATYSTGYSYDQAGKLTQLTYPSGRTVDYAYNSLGQVKSVSTSFAGITKTLANNTSYLPFGPLQSMTYGNGLVLTQKFDQNYRLQGKEISDLSKLDFAYSAVDNITALTDELNESEDQGFGYDALSRLTTATGSYGALAYQYDSNGNRLTKTADGNADTYEYASDNHHLENIAGVNNSSFSYDASGNMLTKDDMDFTYSDRGRLSRVVNGAITADYLYNAIGQRVAKKVNGVVTYFHYNFAGQLIAETAGNGELIREYIYFGGLHLATIDPAGGGSVYFVHADHLGTPKTLTNELAQVVWKASYRPFGLVNISENIIEFNPRFPGQYFDQETGLYYNYYRFYDPDLGRYITSDPIGLQGGLNTYTYTKGNPVNLMDYFGLSGRLEIHSLGFFIFGHSWITYTPDSTGIKTTYGTFNNRGELGNGIQFNQEVNPPLNSTTMSAQLDGDQEKILMDIIAEYVQKGPDAWTYANPCSGFAKEAWNSSTGEQLTCHSLDICNPGALSKSILLSKRSKSSIESLALPYSSVQSDKVNLFKLIAKDFQR